MISMKILALAVCISFPPGGPNPPAPPAPSTTGCWKDLCEAIKDCDKTFNNAAARQACYTGANDLFRYCLGTIAPRRANNPVPATPGSPVTISFEAYEGTSNTFVYIAATGADPVLIESDSIKGAGLFEVSFVSPLALGDSAVIVRFQSQDGKDLGVDVRVLQVYHRADLNQDTLVDDLDIQQAFDTYSITGDDAWLEDFFMSLKSD